MTKEVNEFINKRGIAKTGTRTNVYSKELCEKIREKLKLSKKQLSDVTIKKVVDLGNKIIARWVVDNAEGTFIPHSKNMGMLCVSKQLLREFSEDKEEKIEKIKSLKISELNRKQLLKIHNLKVGDRLNLLDYTKIKEKIPLLNLSTFYYHYMLIWFNKGNCKIKKASIYRLQPFRQIVREIYENVIRNNKLYFEHQLDSFKKRPIKENDKRRRRRREKSNHR